MHRITTWGSAGANIKFDKVVKRPPRLGDSQFFLSEDTHTMIESCVRVMHAQWQERDRGGARGESSLAPCWGYLGRYRSGGCGCQDGATYVKVSRGGSHLGMGLSWSRGCWGLS